MTVWDNVFGSGDRSERNAQGGHTLDSGAILRQTHPDAISPSNPPAWTDSNVRTGPIEGQWRSVSYGEVAAMQARAAQREQESINWGAYLDALERMEQCDATDQKRFRDYQQMVAEAELAKLEANAKLAEFLHEIRPEYAELMMRLGVAEERADRRVAELRQQYSAMLF